MRYARAWRARRGSIPGRAQQKGDNALFRDPSRAKLSASLMPRRARVIAAGVPHHITHRGNNRQDVFLSDEDRRRYQDLLIEQLEPCAVSVLGWCWMSNHVHLIAVPGREDSFSQTRSHSW